MCFSYFFFFQAEDGIRDVAVTGVQTCALPICMERLLLRGNYPAIATHDVRILEHAKAFARDKGVAPARFEFQMLYGVRRDLQLALKRQGYNVRVYVPFGTQWYPYLMRRLAERPANVAFLLGNVVRESLRQNRRRGRAARGARGARGGAGGGGVWGGWGGGGGGPGAGGGAGPRGGPTSRAHGAGGEAAGPRGGRQKQGGGAGGGAGAVAALGGPGGGGGGGGRATIVGV